MYSRPVFRSRLRVVAEADPGALARVLEGFQNLNVLPRQVLAEVGTNDTLHVDVEIVGLTEDQLDLITAKIGRSPCTVSAYWHRM
jgi:hypothetical protein